MARRGVNLADSVAQGDFQVAHCQQNALESTHIGIPMGGLDIKILLCHLRQQIADVVDNGVQACHHLRSGTGQLCGLILAGDLGHGRIQIALYQQLHPLGAGLHGHADVA